MERVRRLKGLWSWLPTFRVAAETEHLPTASEMLLLSPSTISRTVRLLEDQLGRDLFERRGRAMRLNREGQLLLGVVRDAMRILDEGVEAVMGASLGGVVEISVPRDFAGVFVVPTLGDLKKAAPELTPLVRDAPPSEVNGLLLRGRLDVALLLEPTPHADVAVEELATISHGVYAAGRGHPLVGRRALGLAELLEHDFVVPPRDDWPVEHRRRVGARVADLAMAADVCAETGLLASLPDVLVGAHPRGRELARLPVEPTRQSTLYVAYRRPLVHHARTEVVLDALRERSRAL